MEANVDIPRHILSKSTFMRGCQCTKSLWLHKYMPGEKDEITDAQQAIFLTGTNVGMLARDLFPGGVDASPVDAYHFQQSVRDTKEFLNQGEKIIYEAAFQHDGILSALDILVQVNGKWYGYEVKSSTSVKDQFIQDAALQYFVITNAGIELEDIFIVHLDNEYVRQGNLDLEELFIKASVKEDVLTMQDFIASKAEELKKVLTLPEFPVLETGKHCTKPYTCDFYSFCWKDMLEDNDHGEESIMREEISSFLKELTYPLYFMDFETYMVAVPEHDGHWPYRQVPFQYSIHIQVWEGAPLEHRSYLAPNDCDPCPEFVKNLVKDLGSKGSIIVYNQAFENTRLKELKEDYPAYARAIGKIQDRIIDLMVPFRRKHYYLPAMQGSYSIKYVLPALIPEMSYEGMKIANGGDASAAFYNLRNEKDDEVIRTTREALLAYCELDTLAMVKILEKLKTEI